MLHEFKIHTLELNEKRLFSRKTEIIKIITWKFHVKVKNKLKIKIIAWAMKKIEMTANRIKDKLINV